MDYERGLSQLVKLARGTSWYIEFLGYEAQLRENLKEEEKYGTNERIRSDRAKIIEQLNRLASNNIHTSFNELCNNKQIDQIKEETSQSDHSKEQSNINTSIQNTQILQTAPKKVHLSSPGKVLVSCSSKDSMYLEELRIHLAQEIREGKVVCYDDAEVYPITMWKKERGKVVQAISMAILLLSTDFFKSTFILQNELSYLITSARAEKMAILCVILRPCSFKETDLAYFKAINAPPQPPLNIRTRNERDKIWIEVAESAKDHIKST